jgi:hypothetical protein
MLRNLDLRIDFIPLVHVPNTPASQEHFGRSVLARVLQLLDDIADVDSDTQSAASIAGSPIIALASSRGIRPGASLVAANGHSESTSDTAEIAVFPGAVYHLGEHGRMDVVDLSASLNALLKLGDVLLQRLSVNSQIPAELLGRVNASQVPSGVALALAFGPFRSLIAVLRLVREQKYALMLKFVQRLAQAGGVLDPGAPMPARVVFGNYLPADRKALIDEVVALLKEHAISRSMALQLLVVAGIDVADAEAELQRIASTDFVGAEHMFNAVGDEDAARSYLGIPGSSPHAAQPPPPGGQPPTPPGAPPPGAPPPGGPGAPAPTPGAGPGGTPVLNL